jgi:hypothetical protein
MNAVAGYRDHPIRSMTITAIGHRKTNPVIMITPVAGTLAQPMAIMTVVAAGFQQERITIARSIMFRLCRVKPVHVPTGLVNISQRRFQMVPYMAAKQNGQTKT